MKSTHKQKSVVMFSEPVKTFSATELNSMPHTAMMLSLEKQESHAKKELSIGHKAGRLLSALRNGAKLTELASKSRSCFFLDGEKIQARSVRQLQERGYLYCWGFCEEQERAQ